MLLGVGRLSKQRILTLSAAVFLLVYLVYDLLSYEIKPEKKVYPLAKDRLRRTKNLGDKSRALNKQFDTGSDKQNEKEVVNQEVVTNFTTHNKEEVLNEKVVTNFATQNEIEVLNQQVVTSFATQNEIEALNQQVVTGVDTQNKREALLQQVDTNSDIKNKEEVHKKESLKDLTYLTENSKENGGVHIEGDNVTTASKEENLDDIIDNDNKSIPEQTTNETVNAARAEGEQNTTNGTFNWEVLRTKSRAYRNMVKYEGYPRLISNISFSVIVNKARYISGLLHKSKIVLLSFVCQTCVPFVENWLCNTEALGLHRYVLLVTIDTETENKLKNRWPEVHAVSLQSSLSLKKYKQIRMNGSALLLCKIQLINSLLSTGISLLQFDAKAVWFENPLRNFSSPKDTKIDMAVSIPNSTINTGFIVLYATKRTQSFWKALYIRLRQTEKRLSEDTAKQVPNALEKYYPDYLQKMVEFR